TTLIPICEHADPQSEESRPNERSRDDGTDGEHAETKLKKIDWQEHGYRAVREGAHGTRCQDLQRILRCPLRDQSPPLVRGRCGRRVSHYGAGWNTQIDAGSSGVARTARNSLSSAALKKEVRAPFAVGRRAIRSYPRSRRSNRSMKPSPQLTYTRL